MNLIGDIANKINASIGQSESANAIIELATGSLRFLLSVLYI